jgi:hypothetical protein
LLHYLRHGGFHTLRPPHLILDPAKLREPLEPKVITVGYFHFLLLDLFRYVHHFDGVVEKGREIASKQKI